MSLCRPLRAGARAPSARRSGCGLRLGLMGWGLYLHASARAALASSGSAAASACWCCSPDLRPCPSLRDIAESCSRPAGLLLLASTLARHTRRWRTPLSTTALVPRVGSVPASRGAPDAAPQRREATGLARLLPVGLRRRQQGVCSSRSPPTPGPFSVLARLLYPTLSPRTGGGVSSSSNELSAWASRVIGALR